MAIAMTFLSYHLTFPGKMTPEFILLFFCVGLMVAGQAILNDVCDLDLDRIAKPRRPLASNKISKKNASIISVLFTLLSIFISSFINLYCFIFVIFTAFLLTIYSIYLKKQYGFIANILSALLTSAICFSGCFLSNNYIIMVPIAITVFFASIAREIAKDLEDLPYDQLFRKNSLPMIIGSEKSFNVAVTFVALQIISSYLPYYFNIFNKNYFILISLLNFSFSILLIMKFNSLKLNFQHFQKLLKVFMVLYLFAYFQ